MVDRRQNERSQVTPEIERRRFIQAGLASARTVLATSVLPSQIVSALADIISERCNRAIWPHAWFTRR
jgi:hypothetical protein